MNMHYDRSQGKVPRRQALIAGLLVMALAGPSLAQSRPIAKVWKDPSCGCCKDWISHLQAIAPEGGEGTLKLPATEVLVGNHKTLTDFLLPDWDSERPASARELAVAAGERSAPPDDCGGPGGYESLLETLADPEDPEHKSSHVWASSQKGKRGKFDPEAFDEQQVNFANPAPRLKRLLAYLASRR